MGLFSSNLLSEEEIDDLVSTTVFTQPEIEVLYERFKLLDRSNLGYLGCDDFKMLPEFNSNPMSTLLIEAMEKYTDFEKITFPSFLDILQVFSAKTNREKRVGFVFECFNMNGNGRICRDVLLRLYSLLIGLQYDKERARDAIDEILTTYAGKKDYLDQRDFLKFYSENNLDDAFVINFSENIPKKRVAFW